MAGKNYIKFATPRAVYKRNLSGYNVLWPPRLGLTVSENGREQEKGMGILACHSAFRS